MSTESGEKVTINRSLGLTTVYSCINILAQTIAALPFGVYKNGDLGKEKQKGNRVHNLLYSEPNRYMTSFNFWMTIVVSLLGWGNAYAKIVRNISGLPVSLTYLKPWDVEIKELDGDYFYFHKGDPISDMDILHFRMFTKDGINGISPITQNAESIGFSLKQEKFASRSYGTTPPGFLTTEQTLDKDQRKQNKDSWKSQTTGNELGTTPMLSGGISYQTIQLPPKDVEFVKTRKFSKEDICSIFRIPPVFVANFEDATYANGEQQDLFLAKHAVTPIITCIEQECNKKLFPESNKTSKTPLYTKHNLTALLRADTASRESFYKTMWSLSAFSANDILDKEDMKKYVGGDHKFVQSGFVTVEEAVKPKEEKESEPDPDKKPLEQVEDVKA